MTTVGESVATVGSQKAPSAIRCIKTDVLGAALVRLDESESTERHKVH